VRLPVEPMRGACPGLSQRELALLAHVAASVDDTGVQPTYRDIQKFLGYKSTNSVMSIIQKLLMKGVIWETTGHGFAFDWKAYLRFRSLVHGRKICGTVRGKRSTS
jgi:hypothetical protein